MSKVAKRKNKEEDKYLVLTRQRLTKTSCFLEVTRNDWWFEMRFELSVDMNCIYEEKVVDSHAPNLLCKRLSPCRCCQQPTRNAHNHIIHILSTAHVTEEETVVWQVNSWVVGCRTKIRSALGRTRWMVDFSSWKSRSNRRLVRDGRRTSHLTHQKSRFMMVVILWSWRRWELLEADGWGGQGGGVEIKIWFCQHCASRSDILSAQHLWYVTFADLRYLCNNLKNQDQRDIGRIRQTSLSIFISSRCLNFSLPYGILRT